MTTLLDIECYPNVFFCGAKDYHTREYLTFEMSPYCDDREKFFKWYSNYKSYLVTFNGEHYDNVVDNFFIKEYNSLKDLNIDEFCTRIKRMSDLAIEGEYENIKKYKYSHGYTSIDLFLYWSKMLRVSKKISLKSLAVQFGWDEIQELPYHHTKTLSKEEIEVVKRYNLRNDLGILEKLFIKLQPEISQRTDAIQRFGFDKRCYSWDGVKLGLNILLKEYCEEYNIDYNSIKNLRTNFPDKGILIRDIILDKVQFKPTTEIVYTTIEKKKVVYNCNSFYTLFNHIKDRTVFSTKDLSYSVVVNGVKYDIKSGGLHSWHKDDIVEPDSDLYYYKDIDVGSYYPTLGSEYSFVPAHLPGMDKVIKKIKILRLEYKAQGNKKDAELYKLALNGGYYGNLNSEYTCMYDPSALLSVTINGQLFLLMLCEKMSEEGITIDMCNTDGVTCIIPKDKLDIFYRIYKEWEELTHMVLEEVDYKKVIRKNINNYLAIQTNGKVKRKGLFKFDDEIPLGDSVDEQVIAKALTLYYLDNIPIEESITNPSKYNFHIYDYCMSNKISKEYEVIHNNIKVQNMNRYYFSKQGPFLFKKKNNKNTLEHINVGEGVLLFNKYEEKSWEDYKINYTHYIAEARQIIDELNTKQRQLSLF